jgi:hypothetical protein
MERTPQRSELRHGPTSGAFQQRKGATNRFLRTSDERPTAELTRRPRRLQEAVLDRDPVAARKNALLIVGIDAGVNEDRAATRMQQCSQFIGPGQI